MTDIIVKLSRLNLEISVKQLSDYLQCYHAPIIVRSLLARLPDIRKSAVLNMKKSYQMMFISDHLKHTTLKFYDVHYHALKTGIKSYTPFRI
jgi:hypothetical protein